jgi:hypothetical protein
MNILSVVKHPIVYPTVHPFFMLATGQCVQCEILESGFQLSAISFAVQLSFVLT